MGKQQPKVAGASPTIQDLLTELTERLPKNHTHPERIEIQQATPYEYAVRVYNNRGDEYESVLLSFPLPAEDKP